LLSPALFYDRDLRHMERTGSPDETGELRQIRDRLETLRKDEAALTGYELDLVRFEIAYLLRQQARLEPRRAEAVSAPVAAPSADDFWAGWDAD
jgi:hypothetical protein